MTSDLPHRFGRRVALLRKARNLEQHQLGQRIGRDNKFISRIETGTSFPRPDIIEKLAKALQVPVTLLFWDQEVDNNPRIMRKAVDSFLDKSDARLMRKLCLQILIFRED